MTTGKKIFITFFALISIFIGIAAVYTSSKLASSDSNSPTAPSKMRAMTSQCSFTFSLKTENLPLVKISISPTITLSLPTDKPTNFPSPSEVPTLVPTATITPSPKPTLTPTATPIPPTPTYVITPTLALKTGSPLTEPTLTPIPTSPPTLTPTKVPTPTSRPTATSAPSQITNNIQTTPEVTVSISPIQPKIPTSGNLLPTILMVIGGIFLLILGFAF